MCVPGIEEAKLVSVADGGRSIVVDSSTLFHRVPIYQRYRWELMDRQSLEVSAHSVSSEEVSQHTLSNATSPLSGGFTSSSSDRVFIPDWRDFSVKFRLPYSSMVSYETYHDPTSDTVFYRI